MFQSAKRASFAALFAMVAVPAVAADIYEPPVYEAPPAAEVVYEDAGGWYIRGDLGYRFSQFRGAEYIRYGSPGVLGTFDFGHFRGSFSAGGGVGYQISRHLRADLTIDWLGKSAFVGQTTGVCGPPPGTACTSVDRTSYSALLLLANAYVDLGTWHRITPYVGAGVGGAWVKWDTLHNRDANGDTYHGGGKGWRFAYALMAGASYCVNKNWNADVGYRFAHIQGGRMFNYANNGGPGWDKGIFTHEVRAGLRYNFGGKSSGCEGETVPYQPVPEPIYTK